MSAELNNTKATAILDRVSDPDEVVRVQDSVMAYITESDPEKLFLTYPRAFMIAGRPHLDVWIRSHCTHMIVGGTTGKPMVAIPTSCVWVLQNSSGESPHEKIITRAFTAYIITTS